MLGMSDFNILNSLSIWESCPSSDGARVTSISGFVRAFFSSETPAGFTPLSEDLLVPVASFLGTVFSWSHVMVAKVSTSQENIYLEVC